jgi:ATP-dependent Clp endopeptidase proteolytic subunit ClpP
MKSWFNIKNKAAGVIDVSIHDEIGLWGISAADFMRELNNHKDATAINLSIHSPGGSVLDGFAMYNALKSHQATVHATVEGIAASAASFILMSADTISMPEDAFIMIHNAWGGAFGDAEEMRQAADVVEKLQNSIVNIYEKRTGLERSEIEQMMADETWMNAEEAVDKGFADTITDKLGVAAKSSVFDKHFKSMPKNMNQSDDIEKITNIKEFERHLRDAYGLSKGLATALTSRAKSVFTGDPENDDSSINEILDTLERFK